MRTIRALAVAFGCIALAAASCTGGERDDCAPLEVAWESVELPRPRGPEGRVAVRDAVACHDTWWAVGGVIGDDGESVPAGWTSTDDGATWASLRFALAATGRTWQ